MFGSDLERFGTSAGPLQRVRQGEVDVSGRRGKPPRQLARVLRGARLGLVDRELPANIEHNLANGAAQGPRGQGSPTG
jgi:hypothetical protein